MLQSLLAILFLSGLSQVSAECGYAACDPGRPDMLNIHLVPHGHCDTGWLKTVDQYYYGSQNNLQNKGIQYNIDAVVQSLNEDSRRKFTWIEVAYFWRWWGEQTETKKQLVRKLVERGQLMFGNNAWEMNDEASVNYQEIIDQHTLGERFLNETFGKCGWPLTAWQIDTFGHSREFASLLANMGHDSLYFTRLDYQDKANRIATKSMEMMWHSSKELGAASDIFTGIFYNGYAPPPGFCYSCGDEPIMDDPRIFDYNKDAKIDQFLSAMATWAKAYATNHVFVPMGNDFDYELANRWYVNQDKLIKYINARQAKGSKINVLYSTVPCYTWAVHSTNYTFPDMDYDFFPYASSAHTFWTGTFTSRPTCKGYVRDSNAFLQTCKQLSVLSGLSNKPGIDAAIDHLRRGLAIDVNHGQLPGTQRQIVAYDNMLRLSNGSAECMRVVKNALDVLSPSGGDGNAFLCPLLNISECEPLDVTGKVVPVTLYNPHSQPVQHWFRIPIQTPKVVVKDHGGNVIGGDVMQTTQRTLAIPERNSTTKWEVLVNVTIPAMGFTTVTVDTLSGLSMYRVPFNRYSRPMRSPDEDFYISNEFLRLDFNSATRLLDSITNLKSGKTTSFSADMRYYDGYAGAGQHSGAYIFRPVEETANVLAVTKLSILRGSQVLEARQEFGSWATMITRLYRGTPYVEVEWTVGPIPMNGTVGKEVIINYQSGLMSDGVVYTDSSGRQMIQRKFNYRPTWNFSNTEPVSGNYYPLNTAMYIRDETAQTQLTVLVDRAQGGASLHYGQMEVMLHRRLGVDDGFGVAQALNELGSDGKGLIARGKHWLVFDTITKSPALMREYIPKLQLRPSVIVRSVLPQQAQWSALRATLPVNLQVLSLDGWTGGKVLMRLEHPFQAGEDAKLSLPVTVDIATIFTQVKIISVEEVTLAGAMPLSQLNRLKWRSKKTMQPPRRAVSPRGPGFTVTLKPMEIRTFILTV